jgi:hypothetical protein
MPPPNPGKGTAIRDKNAGSRGSFFPTCGMESPLTLTLSPLAKGGRGQGVGGSCLLSPPLLRGEEGREWGDPACKNPLPRVPNECGWCTLTSPPNLPSERGGEPRLPLRPRGGLGWGRCLNLYAKTLTTAQAPATATDRQAYPRRTAAQALPTPPPRKTRRKSAPEKTGAPADRAASPRSAAVAP